MKLWLWGLLCLALGTPLPLRADDLLARERFEEGVGAAKEERWEDAARLLEASLQEKDRATTRYNLVLAYTELDRPLEVTRHALALLTLPATAGLAEARQTAEELLARARAKLAVLSLDAVPEQAQLTVDGHPPSLLHQKRVYLLPGYHDLELRSALGAEEHVRIQLQAGQTQPWPRSLSPSSAAAVSRPSLQRERAAPKPAPSVAAFRRRLAVSLGVAGALATLTSLSLYIAAEYKGSQLPNMDVMGDRYVGAAEQYGRLKLSIAPLALTGGVLMAGGVGVGPRLVRRGSLGWSIACLLLGGALAAAGAVFTVQSPDTLVPDTVVMGLSRQGGSLLMSASLPLLTYGIGLLVRRK
ncbi:MAG TPA: hypothetical protein VFZ61_07980 [Polyangiales bacterium]